MFNFKVRAYDNNELMENIFTMEESARVFNHLQNEKFITQLTAPKWLKPTVDLSAEQ